MITVECVEGPLDGEIEVHEMQNFAYMYNADWGEAGYYQGNRDDGKMYWVKERFPWISKP